MAVRPRLTCGSTPPSLCLADSPQGPQFWPEPPAKHPRLLCVYVCLSWLLACARELTSIAPSALGHDKAQDEIDRIINQHTSGPPRMGGMGPPMGMGSMRYVSQHRIERGCYSDAPLTSLLQPPGWAQAS